MMAFRFPRHTRNPHIRELNNFAVELEQMTCGANSRLYSEDLKMGKSIMGSPTEIRKNLKLSHIQGKYLIGI